MAAGVYVARTDTSRGVWLTTYDLRVYAPNTEVMQPAAAHSLEHLLAVWFRNLSREKDNVVYFGPMGCLTGFYLTLFGTANIPFVKEELIKALGWCLEQTEVFGATEKECGNYRMHSLEGAKKIASDYLDALRPKVYIVIATEEERALAKRIYKDFKGEMIVTGVGGTNVLKALGKIPRNSGILNVGYAGSRNLIKGKCYEISHASLLHENADYDEPVFTISEGLPPRGVRCYTSTDFVTETDKEDCVFDMELAFICAMGFEHVRACKVVSDNCNYKEYEDTIK